MPAYRSMVSIRFSPHPAINYDQAKDASSKEMYSRLFKFLIQKGIYWPPAELETFFISGAHTEKDLGNLRGALEAFFKSGK